jgi:FtsH-binding integral membrane protein
MNSFSVFSEGSGISSKFFLYSILLFGLIYLISYGLKTTIKNYLQQQYSPEDLALDEDEEQSDNTQKYLHENLYNVPTFAISLYVVCAPFLFNYLTLGFSSFLLPIIFFCGFIQLILALLAQSSSRKMQANISFILFVLWLALVFLFLDFGIRS